jgi:hypothetical protein
MQITGSLTRFISMEATSDKAVRERCREMIMLYLRGSTQPVDLRALAPIYHGFYAMRNGAPRWQNLSGFLARMETDGLVRCTYRRDGVVASVEPGPSHEVDYEVLG